MESKNIWYISKCANLDYFIGARPFHFSEQFVKLGYPTTLFCSSTIHSNSKIDSVKYVNQKDKNIINGINVIWLSTPNYNSTTSFMRVWSWIVFELKVLFHGFKQPIKPNIIIVSSIPLFSIFSGFIFAKLYGAKLVFEVRDIWPLTIVESSSFTKSNPFIYMLSLVEKFAYKVADIVVGTMPNLKEHIVNTVTKKVKVSCIPQGLKIEEYEHEEEVDNRYLEQYFPNGKFIITYAGTIGRTNALETLVEAAQKIYTIDKSIHFVIIGNGEYKSKLVNMTEGIQNIVFPPPLHRTKILQVLKKSDVLYDSVKKNNIYKFGLSRNKWIDYMYSGKPMLVSYHGYVSMVNEADCGIVVPPEDVDKLVSGIISLKSKSKEELEKMGNNGRSWIVEHREFSKLAQEYIDIIENS